jgi:hypothetical protein
MSKSKKKQGEPSVKAASFVLPKIVTENPLPDTYLIKVDGKWMSAFHPLSVCGDRSKAKRMDTATANVFARHIEYRGKGKCEVVPA